ncbi:MAG TPA: TonB-dependent receptor, partial [Candidatus Binatia bacterium]
MFFLVLFFFILIPNFIRAADSDVQKLPPLISISTRVETSEENVTNSVTLIDDKKIQSRQAETVLEMLREVPGVDVVQSGSRGNGTSVFIRGAESDQVLVLVDGVEVNSTTLGSFDFAHLTTENIERIEVLRGAGGTLYGSQAVGGVIDIITKKGDGPPELALSAAGGNGSTHRQTASLRGSEGKLGYSFSVAHLQTDGFRRFNDDYENLATSARLDYRFTDDTSLKGIFHFTKTDVGLFNSNNFVAPNPGDPNARDAIKQYLGKLEWEQRIFKEWDYRISGSMFKEREQFRDDVDSCLFFGFPCDSKSRDSFRPKIYTGEFQTNYRAQDWSTTTFGIEYKLRQAATSGGIDRAIRNIAYYLQEQIQLFDRRLTLIPGVRLDDHQTFGRAWTPSFSAAYLFKETGTKVRGSYAKGFKAPSLNELFFPTFTPGCPAFGNPDLGPEKSWELNAGFDQEIFKDKVKVAATYFHREIKDLIEGRPITVDPMSFPTCPFPSVFQAQNVGRVRFDGVEWSLALKLLSFLGLNAQYTYLDWDTATGVLPRRPRHRGSVNLNYHQDALDVNLIANIVGQRDDFDAQTFGNKKMPSYARFDLAGSYRWPVQMALVKNVALFAKIENL